MIYINQKRGLIKIIIIIIIAIIVLSYFGFDLRAIIEAPETQGNLGYVWGLLISLWTNYLMQPVLYFWNNIFIDLLWNAFVANLERIRDGQPTDLEINASGVDL